jgi:hypothetical protein
MKKFKGLIIEEINNSGFPTPGTLYEGILYAGTNSNGSLSRFSLVPEPGLLSI